MPHSVAATSALCGASATQPATSLDAFSVPTLTLPR